MTTFPTTFPMKRGDLVPAITATLYQKVGTAAQTPIDLTTALSVKFAMRNRNTRVKEVDALASVVSPAVGSVSYQWVPGDTDTVGHYDCEWQIMWPTGPQTVPGAGYDIIEISEDIAA